MHLAKNFYEFIYKFVVILILIYRLLLLIPENTADRAFSVRKTRIPTEYREKGIRYFKN